MAFVGNTTVRWGGHVLPLDVRTEDLGGAGAAVDLVLEAVDVPWDAAAHGPGPTNKAVRHEFFIVTLLRLLCHEDWCEMC